MVTSTTSNTMHKAGALSHIARVFAMLVLALGFSSVARADAGFVKNFVVVNANGGGDVYYKAGGFQTVPNTSFDGLNLGNFARNGSLILDGGQSQIFKNTANVNSNVSGVRLYYRVYRSGTTAGSFTLITLPFSTNDVSGTSDAYQTWQNVTTGINLLSTVIASTTTVTYIVEAYFQGTDSNNTTTPIFTDNNGGSNYKATFTVDPGGFTSSGGSSTWLSNRLPDGSVGSVGSSLGVNEDWMVPGNWSNGVPTATSDALIPEHTTNSTPTTAPNLYDPNALYEVRNLNMPNGNQNDRSILRLGNSTSSNGTTTNIGATLRIYGNLTEPGAGLLGAVAGTNGTANPLTNSTLVFAGNSDQFIQCTSNVVDVRIEGSGDKRLNGFINTANTLTFAPGTTARIVTVDASNNFVQDPSVAFVNLKISGILFGETNTAYVAGILTADRYLQSGVVQRFGNIGIDITTNIDITISAATPNQQTVAVTRGVGAFFQQGGFPNTVSIKRIFGVSGDVNSNGSTNQVVFHYLNSNGTGPNAGKNPNDNELNGIQENNLVLFRTANGNSGPFIQLASTVNTTNKTITATLTNINTITAGDQSAPLPVNLTKFDAVRNEVNAQLTWTTASETNNKGFYVQMSMDGVNFRDLTFVASKSSNSLTTLNYAFLDKEAGKTGKRYYRLLQTDLSGKGVYSSVKVVNFDGATASSVALIAYPNPFTNDLSLTVDGGSAVHVKLVDMLGRLVQEQDGTGDSSFSLKNLSDITPGVYLAKVTMADGSTQTVRVQKQ